MTTAATTAAPLADRAARVRALARALDSAVRVPGTNIRFGFDAVLGLVPGVGDAAGAVVSAYVIIAAARLGAPAPVLTRMLINTGVDALAGAVPLLGDLFDLGWRANTRNVALLEQHLAAPAAARAASRAVVAAVLAGVALLTVAGITLAVFAVRALWNALQ